MWMDDCTPESNLGGWNLRISLALRVKGVTKRHALGAGEDQVLSVRP